ncbi:autotransporter assembly complex family protein [Paraglaciecola sp.]|uniref:autotransporter assembly complex protein TamA n=1 Tax=Paraglaciecola sp. TaxID=1920173 RepID=UPI0030F377F4
MLLTNVPSLLCVIVLMLSGVFSGVAVAASAEVKGIKSDKILDNVNAHIDSIELPAAAYQFEQYQQRLTEKIEQAVQVFGYYQAAITIKAPSQTNRNDKWQINVELGQVTTVDEVVIELQGEALDDLLMQELLTKLPIVKGKALQHAAYESSKYQLQNLALSLGYFDFKFTEHSIQVVESTYLATIILKMHSGKRYHFGELRFVEDDRAESLVRETLPFNTGEPYEADKLALLSKRLKQTQYFKNALVRPVVAESVDYRVPIEIILTHKPRDNFDLGAGFSSDIGPRFTAKWQRPWVNSHGHAMSAELFLSEPENSISLDYRIPIEDPVQNYASFQVGFQSQNDNDTTSDRFTLSATRHWTVEDSDWQRAAFIRLEQETFIQGLEPEQTTRLLTPGFTLSRLRSKGGLDIYWGDKQSITVEAAADALLSDINMLRVSAQTKWLRSWDLHRVLWRAELGAVATESFQQVPSSLRYFAGGDQSIRGFGYRTLSPAKLNEEGDRELTGGQYLAVGSVEYSYPFSEKWRMAVFMDAGTSTNKFAGDIATGIGAGVNWMSPVGPVRVYVARGNSDYESQWRIHFSMGPAL